MNKELINNDLPKPISICDDCYANKMLGAIESGVIIVHCKHNSAGAFYKPKEKRWRIDSPISEVDYLAAAYEGLERAEPEQPKVIN